jgi:hypothetical protein
MIGKYILRLQNTADSGFFAQVFPENLIIVNTFFADQEHLRHGIIMTIRRFPNEYHR